MPGQANRGRAGQASRQARHASSDCLITAEVLAVRLLPFLRQSCTAHHLPWQVTCSCRQCPHKVPREQCVKPQRQLTQRWSLHRTYQGLPKMHAHAEMLHCIGQYNSVALLGTGHPMLIQHQALTKQAAVDSPPGILSLQADSQTHISHCSSNTSAASTTQ